MNNYMFYYEHIGHMQFSVLTLTCYQSILELSRQSADGFVLFEEVVQCVVEKGFSRKQADGELDRFCYGFECRDKYDNHARSIAFTETGLLFLNEMLKSASIQRSQMALLIRKAKKRDHFNVILQETTFFPEEIYTVIRKHNLRPTGCREFKKCLSVTELNAFCLDFLSVLKSQPVTEIINLEDCIQLVKNEGKFWASVGGKYAWFVFPQRFELPFATDDWVLCDKLIDSLVRPPEWGGGKSIAHDEILALLGNNEEKFELFLKHGVVRPIWINSAIREAKFQLTALGYLAWERKKKGPIHEFWAIKRGDDKYDLALCVASDFDPNIKGMNGGKTLPSLVGSGTRENATRLITGAISKQGCLV